MPALDSPGNRHKDAFAHAAQPAPSGKSARYTSHGVRTHQHMSTGIHYSSRTPPSHAYTQHPDRASTHAIAFTRHPTVAALKTHTHPTQSNSHHPNTHHIHMSRSKVCKRPAPSRHRSPTLSPTVRFHRHSPNTISRWQNLSRPPPVPRCEHASMHRCDWEHKVSTRSAPSRHRSPTLSPTVCGHRHSVNTISRWHFLSHPPPAPR